MESTMMDFPLTVRHIFEHGRTTYADSEVVTNEADGVRRITFGALADRADQLAAGLRRLGVGAGDRVATFAVAQRARNYGGWLHLTPDARFFDDRFTLCLFKSHNRARYFLYAGLVLAHQHFHLGDVELVETRKLCCAARVAGETIRFELDGELVGTLPATFEIVPDALTVLVP